MTTANAAMAGGAFGRPLKWDMLTYGEALDRFADRMGYNYSSWVSSFSDQNKPICAYEMLLVASWEWSGLTSSQKEAAASLCVLLNRDLLSSNDESAQKVLDSIYYMYRYGDAKTISNFRDEAVSEGANAAELDALIAKVSGQDTSTKDTSAPAQAPATSWKQDAKGWWVERADGSYLVSEWYQSPSSGLWYYMGSDGYMLTNTTTPDGYQVNADGVWVQ